MLGDTFSTLSADLKDTGGVVEKNLSIRKPSLIVLFNQVEKNFLSVFIKNASPSPTNQDFLKTHRRTFVFVYVC